MEWEGKIAQGAAVCAWTGAPLAPGSTCFAALVQTETGRFERRDYSPEGWTAQEPDAFVSWWRRTVPAADKRALRLDTDVLRKLFIDLKDHDEPRRRALGYVAALALVRLKALRLVRIARGPEGSSLVLEERGGKGGQLLLRDPDLGRADIEALTEDLLAVIA